MEPFGHLHYLLLLLLLHSSIKTSSPSQENTFPQSHDLNTLLSFKSSSDPFNPFLQTWEGRNPCSGSWLGIKCKQKAVVSIRLDNAFIVGNITPLLQLNNLKVLSLIRNALSGSLPPLTNLTHPNLKHLLLSHNQLSGTLSISLPSLLSLRVEHNAFSGDLRDLHLPLTKDFNVSANRLAGEISPTLSKFPKSSFESNLALCGSPLPSCKGALQNLNRERLADTTVLAVSLGNIVLICITLAFVISIYLWFRKKKSIFQLQSTVHSFPQEKKDDCELVVFEGGERLRLECLLKSSAEVLGKGVCGSTYKALIDEGMIVAVKRLSSVRFGAHGKGYFNRKMRQIGSLMHQNIVCLRAYHNSDEEKLLVYDYMPNGSLQSLLHGSNEGIRQINIVLNWSSIMKVLKGAAQGLHFLHTYPSRTPLLHGNIKPSNILIDSEGNGRISEWGLMSLANNIQQSNNSSSSTILYNKAGGINSSNCKAPEIFNGRGKATQESDVYGFGMVILKVVTCKESEGGEGEEEEMMTLIKIGMMCTSESPQERPKMGQVLCLMREVSRD